MQLIDEILDISKVETGQLTLNDAPMAVADVVDECLDLVRARAEAAELELSVDLEPDLPPLNADERLIKQSLLHLVFNAVKFTGPGDRVAVRACRGNDGALAISVTDTGIGIAAEDIPSALAAFGQVNSALDRKYDGSGLGLTLVKSFIELHGGRLEIDSMPGVGTTVTLVFPAERSGADPVPGGMEPQPAYG